MCASPRTSSANAAARSRCTAAFAAHSLFPASSRKAVCRTRRFSVVFTTAPLAISAKCAGMPSASTNERNTPRRFESINCREKSAWIPHASMVNSSALSGSIAKRSRIECTDFACIRKASSSLEFTINKLLVGCCPYEPQIHFPCSRTASMLTTCTHSAETCQGRHSQVCETAL